jgi:hypothetical protein
VDRSIERDPLLHEQDVERPLLSLGVAAGILFDAWSAKGQAEVLGLIEHQPARAARASKVGRELIARLEPVVGREGREEVA